MTARQRAEALWPEIRKRFVYELRGSQGAVIKLVAKAIREAERAARHPEPAGETGTDVVTACGAIVVLDQPRRIRRKS